jgi:hypothetical protein
MKYHTDKDGKSKTASAVHTKHYPEQHEAVPHDHPNHDHRPTREQIEARAFELWTARGRPIGTPDLDWLQAESDLEKEAAAHAPLHGVQKETGSVQP